ncbi:PREDICTED: D-galactoside-specific lectin-like [Acropora digitifera]|uniref:D-galactoside-specific lectin-like n=1 Tax=Acropora digitifera TaxID=70779 RepID=UPI00077AA125|nr:PREDICTED: D-galactoside-specific lectin-like [Acropora digitifera]
MELRQNVTSVTICEHERQTISCEGGATISVLEASYGRHDRKTCPKEPIRTTNCNAGSSLSVVQSSCNDQASCNLFASNSVFGDPCFGTVKYLQVKYECIEAPDPCDSDPCQNGGTCTNLGDNNFECEYSEAHYFSIGNWAPYTIKRIGVGSFAKKWINTFLIF